MSGEASPAGERAPRSRRRFLLRSAAIVAGVSGAMVVGWGVLPARSRQGEADLLAPRDGTVALNGWVRVGRNGQVSLVMPRAEMGQGAYTGLATLLAEELSLPVSAIALEQAGFDAIYGNVAMLVGGLPFHPEARNAESPGMLVRGAEWMVGKIARELGVNATGGSSTMADGWHVVRMAGATVRGAFLAAGAQHFDVPRDEVNMADGFVTHAGSGRALPLGELVDHAAAIEPGDVKPLDPSVWQRIGTMTPRIDIPAKVDGTAQFGIDVRLPDMVYAAIRHCPTLGGRLQSLDTERLRAMPGVVAVIELPPLAGATGGFAVVARHWWQANAVAQSAQPVWLHGELVSVSDASLRAQRLSALDGDDGHVFHARGDVDAAMAGAPTRVTASYDAPYLAHATLEPMNATAWWNDDRLAVWAPTQVPGFARDSAAAAAGIDKDAVDLTVTLLGGGFGRRLETDAVAQAAHVARAVPGRPVQLIWSREEDTTHDFLRPAQTARLSAGLDDAGKPVALDIRAAGESVVPQWLARNMSLPGGGPDKTTAEGLFDQAYGIAHQRIAHVKVDSGIPCGFWRAVGHSHNAFFIECFVDEMALAAGVDPLAFRRDLLAHSPRHLAVLDLVASASLWSEALPPGRARGLAVHESFGSVVAQVVDVSLNDNRPRVHRVFCAIDCGLAVNPDVVAQQMESGVIFGLTAALYGRVTIDKGQVRERNFPDYPLLGLADAPVVETHIVPGGTAPRGVGEPGLPPIAPALGNALFVLTGKRLRSLPFDLNA